MTENLRLGCLISGGGTNLQAILDACDSGRIHGNVVFVGADTPQAQGLDRARRRGIPVFVVDYADIISRAGHRLADPPPADLDLRDVTAKCHRASASADPVKMDRFLISRAVAEARLLEQMAPYPFDLLALAGFMRTLTPYFIDRVNTAPDRPRIMNIHPSLLPAFPGVDGYGDTFRYGCKVGGCTVHFIDYGEDTGPIIGQRSFSIEPDDTLDDVRRKGLALEWSLYPDAIQLYAEGRLETVCRRVSEGNGRTVYRTVVRQLPPRCRY